MNQASPYGDGENGGAILNIELREDVPQCAPDRFLADAQGGADFLVAQALGDQLDDLDLPRGQGSMRGALRQPGLDVRPMDAGRDGPRE